MVHGHQMPVQNCKLTAESELAPTHAMFSECLFCYLCAVSKPACRGADCTSCQGSDNFFDSGFTHKPHLLSLLLKQPISNLLSHISSYNDEHFLQEAARVADEVEKQCGAGRFWRDKHISLYSTVTVWTSCSYSSFMAQGLRNFHVSQRQRHVLDSWMICTSEVRCYLCDAAV